MYERRENGKQNDLSKYGGLDKQGWCGFMKLNGSIHTNPCTPSSQCMAKASCHTSQPPLFNTTSYHSFPLH